MTLSIDVQVKDTSYLRLQILNPDGYEVTSVLRTTTTSTYQVRYLDGQLPSTAAEILLPDYEYPLGVGQSIVYTVTTAEGYTASCTIDQDSIFTNVATGLLFLAVPLSPDAGMDLGSAGCVITILEEYVTGRTTLHQVVGRAEPLAVLHAAAARTGRMDIACPSRALAQQVRALLARPLVFQLRQSDQVSIDVYFVVQDMTVTHGQTVHVTDGRRERWWTVAVTWAETSWPVGPLIPITVWTYADVNAAYGDYAALAYDFGSYLDLLERQTVAHVSLLAEVTA